MSIKKHHSMNVQLVESRIKAAGQTQRKAGKLTASRKIQDTKGAAREHTGQVEQTAGDLEEAHRESGEH